MQYNTTLYAYYAVLYSAVLAMLYNTTQSNTMQYCTYVPWLDSLDVEVYERDVDALLVAPKEEVVAFRVSRVESAVVGRSEETSDRPVASKDEVAWGVNPGDHFLNASMPSRSLLRQHPESGSACVVLCIHVFMYARMYIDVCI